MTDLLDDHISELDEDDMHLQTPKGRKQSVMIANKNLHQRDSIFLANLKSDGKAKVAGVNLFADNLHSLKNGPLSVHMNDPFGILGKDDKTGDILDGINEITIKGEKEELSVSSSSSSVS